MKVHTSVVPIKKIVALPSLSRLPQIGCKLPDYLHIQAEGSTDTPNTVDK